MFYAIEKKVPIFSYIKMVVMLITRDRDASRETNITCICAIRAILLYLLNNWSPICL